MNPWPAARAPERSWTRAGAGAAFALFASFGAATAQPVPLTSDPAEDRDAAWSPDGRWVYFSSDRAGGFDLYRVAASGGEPEPVVVRPGHDRFPSAAPDGRRIAYQSGEGDEAGLWLAGPLGEDPRLLLRDPSAELTPHWSPDGRRIAFTSDRSGNIDLWVVGADGAGLARLTDHPHRDVWPRWSPDGGALLFFSRRDTDEEWDELYVMALPDGAPRRLTDNGRLHDFSPSWSPDGRHIVTAVSDAVATRALVVYDASGRVMLRFGEGYHRIFQPAWSPDGRWIVAAVRTVEGEAAELMRFEVPAALRPGG